MVGSLANRSQNLKDAGKSKHVITGELGISATTVQKVAEKGAHLHGALVRIRWRMEPQAA
jgi:orotate phosphoribosyltransferase-like protein